MSADPHDLSPGSPRPAAPRPNAEAAWEERRRRTSAFNPVSWARWLWTLLIGRARNPFDAAVFHRLALVAFFAWVGLGSDGLSSSCYGPAEAFRALGEYPALAIFVALASAATVFIISAGYSQIIELFPAGGGGYVVASKLLSPKLGMIAGCALLLDYVLTIAISIASGADALFSFLPAQAHVAGWSWDLVPFKLPFAAAILLLLMVLNLRGVRESVIPLVPVFLTFLVVHVAVIVLVPIGWAGGFVGVVEETAREVEGSTAALGLGGALVLMLKAYSMGAGTYTGIEAVSNGLPILREPRVETGKRTMRYMAWSLAVLVVGLMFAYLLVGLGEVVASPEADEIFRTKTLNALLFERFTAGWPAGWGAGFVLVALLSEAAILFIAAQAGFLGGPRILSAMALDSWMPHRFASLSDRLVTQNGVLLMSGAALLTIVGTRGRVDFLVVLYAINVFITFVLSQLGMVRHWWGRRQANQPWRKGMLINGVGLVLCSFILVAVTVLKFEEGGWITIFITGALIGVVLLIRRHYDHTKKLLRRLDTLVRAAEAAPATADGDEAAAPAYDPNAKTAVLLVNGFNGLGLHTLLNIVRLWGDLYRNFVFVQVGVVDAGNFKGAGEVDHLAQHLERETQRYVDFVRKQGYYGEAVTSVGTDVVQEIADLAPRILEKHPQAVFFGGQLVFPTDTLLSRALHNNTVFALQRRFYNQGVPMVILPIRV